MTSLRQIKGVFKPILERHADVFVVGGRDLWIGPIHHVARRIFIERSYLANCANLKWNIQEIFLPNRQLLYYKAHFSWHYMRDPPGADELFGMSWQWSDPTMVPQLVSMLENEALPALRSLDTLQRYADMQRALHRNSRAVYPEDRLILNISLGNLDAARSLCLELLPQYCENKDPYWWIDKSLRTAVLTVAEPLMAGDRPALAAILHGWEEANVRGTVLEPHWEPTPFPLETA